jgi:prepilin-type N-terminal cleavage/methylation domain-containing protein
MKERGAFTLIELLVVVAILAILFGLIGGCAGGCSISDGTRKGSLTKFSKKGIIFRTLEGELVMGGFKQTASGSGANVWDFSVRQDNPNKDEIAGKLNMAIEQDIPVTLKYKQSLIVMPWNAGTTYDITEIHLHTNTANTVKSPPLEQ